MFLLFEQAGGAQKFTGPPREKPASGSATPQKTSDFGVKKVGSRFPFPGPYRLPPIKKAGFGGLALLVVFLDMVESSRTHARKGLWRPGEGPSPRTGGKRDTPNRERPLAAPKTPKNADIKKGFVGTVWAARSAQNATHKKDFVPTVSPHPAEAQESAPGTGVGRSV